MAADAVATAKQPEPPRKPGFRGFVSARWDSLVRTLSSASNPEKVRAVLALMLVGLLVALQFWPTRYDALATATETLAITVVAFYFGLHSGSSSKSDGRPTRSGSGTSTAVTAKPSDG